LTSTLDAGIVLELRKKAEAPASRLGD
jgi:hypothetical protein